MSDEETQVDPEQDVEAEEGDVAEPPPLDVAAIITEAEARYAKMVENGRVDADKTYAGFVIGLTKESQESISTALLAEAERRTGDKTGPYNRRRLAAKVVAGEYDAA